MKFPLVKKSCTYGYVSPFWKAKDLLATYRISKECYEGCLVALHNIPLLQ
ncbi:MULTISPECIES: hypothetical protein [Bacillus]|nr:MULTISPECIES: hypothetical protein [Bacillus]